VERRRESKDAARSSPAKGDPHVILSDNHLRAQQLILSRRDLGWRLESERSERD